MRPVACFKLGIFGETVGGISFGQGKPNGNHPFRGFETHLSAQVMKPVGNAASYGVCVCV